MKILNKKKYFIILIILLLIDCGIGGFIANWRSSYWDSISGKHLQLWFYLVSQFTVAAIISCFINGISSYIANILSLSIRTDLTKKALKLEENYELEGRAQRIQEDCFAYPTLLLSLANGLVRSLVMIGVYIWIISMDLSFMYILFTFGYAVIGTLVAGKIAHPLINLNYINQVFEARFRQHLSKANYNAVHRNNYNLFKRTKYLTYFQSFYDQITIIIPHLVLASLYFTSKITFGIFMQAASAMLELIGSLSFLINSFGEINRLLSCRRRLKEMKVI